MSATESEREERGPLENELDTMLSYKGNEQAFKTGQYIVE